MVIWNPGDRFESETEGVSFEIWESNLKSILIYRWMEAEDRAHVHNAIFLKDKEVGSNAKSGTGNKLEMIIPSE